MTHAHLPRFFAGRAFVVAAARTLVLSASMAGGLLVATGAHAATAAPAGAVIGNQASATYSEASAVSRTVTSNTVVTTVQQVGSLTLAAPGAKTISPGGQVYYPQTLVNTGNGNDSFLLTAVQSGATTMTTVLFHADANGDGIPDSAVPIAATGTLAPGQTFKFVVAGVTPATAVAGTTNTTTVTATSVFAPAVNAPVADVTTVSGQAVVNVTQAIDLTTGPSPSNGRTITVTYTNTGNATAIGVTLADLIPSGMTYVANSARWSVTGVVNPVLNAVLPTVLDPLLSLTGIRIGEVDITGGGTYNQCSVSGCVYADADHNARQDSGETGTGATLYAKLVNPATPTVASVVVAVDPTTGNYAFPTLNPATYTVVISTSNATSAVAPLAPAGWIGTRAPTLSRSVTVAAADLAAQSFGLFHGSSLAGSVFKDNGGGGGTANNGVRDGAEAALGGVTVNVTDATGATVWDTERSDPAGAFVAWIPSTAGTGVLKVSQAADATMVFVSGSAGTTGGAFTPVGATTSFTHVADSVYTGVNFGDVPLNRLDTDGQQSVAAGATALYAHALRAGSAGQLSFSTAPLATPPAGWSAIAYLDANCNGQLDPGDTPLTVALSVVADQSVCVVVKVFVPETAANETRTTYTLTASFAYANTVLTGQAQRQDLTIVGTADGLRLVKAVDKTVATSGTVIVYTLTYANQGANAVSALKIRDTTPAWTVFASATCGSLPAGITACNVTAQPAVGTSGSVEWTLAGSLPSGGSGTVVFSVTVL